MTYTSDGRFRAVHAAGSPFWMLEIDSPQARDEGVYECQVSSQPKIYRRFQLQVTGPFDCTHAMLHTYELCCST
ncbi:hypothetical protein HAZT_HAZT002443 [Hyalella azteca]|uniref:Ig-like domain-containing protein n=1 Tax=Hyalella azteca TaxID=294128 RepID=A0A6A0H9I9_HYAAZ|nr:hypothetical protein HAZT_HAZT002443 [Hyalella azteca]